MSKHYKIGTRGSLLAVTQCTLIKEEIEKLTGDSFELNKIKTQGDQQTEKPLWQMDGKDFFTKELDEALLGEKVDLVVHSYKDLGSDRPDGIKLATITRRKFANDILLIKKETIPTIKAKTSFIVGTSSPRRIVNVESSLKDYLPGIQENAQVKCEMLRGNVNTRIQKLRDGNYDAIVLALAGIERLAHRPDSLEELTRLLEGLTFMVMPQKVFPSSASQGALAIEYNEQRKDEGALYKTLRSVHDEITESEVKREREAFQSYGGGCHLAVGIHVKRHKDLFLHIHKGEHREEKVHKVELEGIDYSPIKDKSCYVVLGKKDILINKEQLATELNDNSNYFVTSKYCIPAVKKLQNSSFWAAGTRSMKQLVDAGHWVNGSADGMGHEIIENLKDSKAISLMLPGEDWKTLSHDMADSPVGETVACYTRKLNETSIDELKDFDCLYWSSFYQYEQYTQKDPTLKNKFHLCGLGKTYDKFVTEGVSVIPFADMQSLKSTTRTNI
jgi:hydroxymethylbilane synthase